MRTLLWRVVEWHLGRHLTADRLACVLGDLEEDLARQQRSAGRLRANLWLVREALSLSAAYRLRGVHQQQTSRRTIMGASWLGDTRFAARRVIRRPAASIASILTLACAIAAGAVTWSVVSALIVHPLPVRDPNRLVLVGGQFQLRDGSWSSVSFSHLYPVYTVVRHSDLFDSLAGGGQMPLLVRTPDGAAPQPRAVYFASHNFFETLGVRPAIGRDFNQDDDRPGAPLAAIVSQRFWQTALNGTPDVVGQQIVVSNTPVTIVGVAPRKFRGLSLTGAPDIYLPLHTVGDLDHTSANLFAQDGTSTSPTSWVTIIARLAPDVTAEQTRARLNDLQADPRWVSKFDLLPVNIGAIPEAVRPGMVQFTKLLTSTVALLLLIGCLTVGMLLLVRTEARRGELAICLALGGTRAGLVRGIVFEGAVLTLGGILLAVPIAIWLFGGLRAFTLPGGVRIDLLELSVDPNTLMAMSGLAVVALMLIAVAAGLFGLSANVGDVLRSRGATTQQVTRRRMRTAVVAAQVAIALVLLAGAGLFARSLSAALTVNTSFDARRMVTGGVSLGQHGYTPERATRFFEELRDRLDTRGEIEAVSLIQWQGGMTPSGTITVNGEARQFPSMVAYTAVDERYFVTMGLPILEGRDFSRDDTAGSPLVVIVSGSFGRALAGGGSPLGYRITETSSRPGEPFAVAEVIGVVPDVITRVDVTEPLVKYYALAQQPSMPQRTLVMRVSSDAGAAVREAGTAIRQMDPEIQSVGLLTIEEQLARQMGPQRLGGFVLGALGGIAVLLTMLGAYVIAESMSSGRRRELGVRAALGASRAHLGGLVLGETVRLVGAGLLTGLGLAWLGANTIRAFLFRVEPFDVATLGTAASAILGLALAVSLKPAIDSARVDLVSTLREE